MIRRTETAVAVIRNAETGILVSMVDRAAKQLASATSSAEILEARLSADIAYGTAKATGRMAQAQAAHDDLISKVHEAQGEALKIKAEASKLYYEETQAAIVRGEIPGRGGARGNQHTGGKVEDVHFANPVQHKEINREGKAIAEAEKADPGIVGRVVAEKIEAGEEPTKAALREAVTEAAMRGLRGSPAPANKNPLYRAPSKAGTAWTHLYGTCRGLVEWATADNELLALHGKAERTDDQSANLAAVRKAADFLNHFLENVDA